MKKILVAISGGTHSAVTAALFKSQGYQVHGVYFRMGDAGFQGRCCVAKKEATAQEVCKKLEIPLKILDLRDEFKDKVSDYFVHERLATRTPNPCVPCNREIRIAALFREADRMECQWVATGHHVQVFQSSDGRGGRLQKAVNLARDQSYLLFGLTQAELARLITPVGGLHDTMVHRLAREFQLPDGLENVQQQICFSDSAAAHVFFEERVPASLRVRGMIRKQSDGSVVGEHEGIHGYNIGQKMKLDSQRRDSEVLYVVGYDLAPQALIVGTLAELYRKQIVATRAHWIRSSDGLKGLACHARMTPAQPNEVPCRVTLFENDILRVEFAEPQLGVLPGQPIVFYENDEVLGGAFIEAMAIQP